MDSSCLPRSDHQQAMAITGLSTPNWSPIKNQLVTGPLHTHHDKAKRDLLERRANRGL